MAPRTRSSSNPLRHQGLDLRGDASRVLPVQELLDVAEELAGRAEGNGDPPGAEGDDEKQEDRGNAGVEGARNAHHPGELRGLGKPVPDAPDRPQVARGARVLFDLGAQAVDMGVHRVLVALELVAPDEVEQVRPAVRPAGVAGKKGQEVELLHRELHRLSARVTLRLSKSMDDVPKL